MLNISSERLSLWNDEKCLNPKHNHVRHSETRLPGTRLESFWCCMVAPPDSESCKISFMKGENQVMFTLMELRRDPLDDLNDYCEYFSPTRSRSNSPPFRSVSHQLLKHPLPLPQWQARRKHFNVGGGGEI